MDKERVRLVGHIPHVKKGEIGIVVKYNESSMTVRFHDRFAEVRNDLVVKVE